MKNDQKQVYESIIKQWNGGERRLAGARASELVYGSGNKPDQKLIDKLQEEAPGIEQYLSAPASGVVVDHVPDEGGSPLSTQPDQNTTGEANQSSEQAKDEQDAIDKKLEPGRKARAKANKADGDTAAGKLVSTKLNPDEENPAKP